MVSIGYPSINFKFEKSKEPTINQDIELLCIMDDFGTNWSNREDGGGVKRFDTLKQALNYDGYKTGALGPERLKLLENFNKRAPVMLADLTGVNGDKTEGVFNSDRFANCLEKLERSTFSILSVPYTMSTTDWDVYKKFYENQANKMRLFGIITPIGNASELPLLENKFPKGGILKPVVTPLDFNDGTELSIEDSVVYHSGFTYSNKPNVSETWMPMSGVTGKITPDELSKSDFDLVQNYGGCFIDEIDVNNNIVGLINSNTPSGMDIKIIRCFNHFFNKLRYILESKYGKDNDNLSLVELGTLVDQLSDDLITRKMIAGAKVKFEKATEDEWGENLTDQINSTVVVDIYDKIFNFDVDGLLNII